MIEFLVLSEDIAENGYKKQEKRDQGHKGKTGYCAGQHKSVMPEKINKALPQEIPAHFKSSKSLLRGFE